MSPSSPIPSAQASSPDKKLSKKRKRVTTGDIAAEASTSKTFKAAEQVSLIPFSEFPRPSHSKSLCKFLCLPLSYIELASQVDSYGGGSSSTFLWRLAIQATCEKA